MNVIAGRGNGEIWFGTGGYVSMGGSSTYGGLTSFDGTAFRLQTVADGLAHPYVRDITFAADTVRVATDVGLTRFHGDAASIGHSRGISYTTSNSALPHNQVHAVAADSAGAEIPFSPEVPGSVRLTICNVQGQPVRALIDGEMAAGHDAVVWDGRDDDGDAVSSGVYLYRMETATCHATRRLLLLR